MLTSLAFLHSLGLVHADLKPENILVKSYSRCQVKVIDLGSSCFLTDHLSSYVQVGAGQACAALHAACPCRAAVPAGPGCHSQAVVLCCWLAD